MRRKNKIPYDTAIDHFPSHTHTRTHAVTYIFRCFFLSCVRPLKSVACIVFPLNNFSMKWVNKTEKTQSQTIDNRNHPKLDESIQIIRVKITNQFLILIWSWLECAQHAHCAADVLDFRMFWQTAPSMGFNVINYSASVSAIEIYACYLWSIALLSNSNSDSNSNIHTCAHSASSLFRLVYFDIDSPLFCFVPSIRLGRSHICLYLFHSLFKCTNTFFFPFQMFRQESLPCCV